MSIEQWIDFAKGPLFALTSMIMVLGLLRHIVIQVYELVAGKGRRLSAAPWRKILNEGLGWAIPIKQIMKGTPFFSSVSYLFHIGVIVVPVFLADHIVLWEKTLGFSLPSLPSGWADFLTIFTVACVLVLLGFRLFGDRQRAMSRLTDYVLLLLILLPFVTGFLASHSGMNPFPWETMMLVHLLSAELLFLVIPFTKLAHIVLFVFDRLSAVHWQLRPGAGDKVADALFGKEARV
ncbi:MAG: respiratory nitrate reductase subunit gamma [bacterium]|nr:respiratory nitrate reductase subunit gamma [bacterium]